LENLRLGWRFFHRDILPEDWRPSRHAEELDERTSTT
jgi:hypothetical protein